ASRPCQSCSATCWAGTGSSSPSPCCCCWSAPGSVPSAGSRSTWPLSELARPLPKLGAYALTALLLAAYALVLWWALHPTVPDSYRAYYIDQTTTCMDQPVAGTYTLGTVVSFLPDGASAARPMKPCGWEGPAGDGTPAVGTSSRLRFAYAEPAPGAL